jgi:hypothetical protein
MRFTNDDFTNSYSEEVSYNRERNFIPVGLPYIPPVKKAAETYVDPEQMSGIIDDFMNKVKSIGTAITGGKDVTISTESGITTIGPSGVAYTSTPQTAAQTAVVPSATSQIYTYLKNPYVIAGLVGIPLLLYIAKKRKSK